MQNVGVVPSVTSRETPTGLTTPAVGSSVPARTEGGRTSRRGRDAVMCLYTEFPPT